MSDIIELGGKCRVIVRAFCDFEVNDYQYNKDDVLFIFDGVDIQFTYNEKIKDKTIGAKNILAFDVRKLNALVIDSASVDSDFIQLFTEKKADKFDIPVVEDNVLISGHKLFPVKTPKEDTKIYIDGFGFFPFTWIENDNYAVIEDNDNALTDDTYNIVYYSEVEKPIFNINNNMILPYLKLEILGKGNINKEEGNVFISIPRASLLTRPDYSLVSSTVTAQNLSFKIIDDDILFGLY